MKIEVPHSADSERFIKKTFKGYKYEKELPDSIDGRCIIHMYAKEDTMINGKNNLTGFIDAYNCDVKIYDVRKQTYYESNYTDGITIDVPCSVKIFKDLSTMIVVDGGINLINGHSITVYR